MNQLQVFNFEENNVRTLTIDNKPYFVAADICDILEIKNARDAVSRLDDDEKATSVVPTQYGDKRMHVINESGLYALIFTSRKDEAKSFRKWVTAEVLPQIRQTGKYEEPKSPMEMLELQFKALKETSERVETVEKDVTYLKEEVKLEAGEYSYISRQVNRTVADTIKAFALANTREVRSALFKDINSGVNDVAGIKTRTQLRQKHFNIVIDFINQWTPSTATLMKTRQITLELAESEEDRTAE